MSAFMFNIIFIVSNIYILRIILILIDSSLIYVW